jgi:hypothetical protein
MKKFSGWLALLACATLLAACGGGGGNPGTVAGVNGSTGTTASKVASVVLVSDADTILSSGATGTEVTLTAVVKDANNNVLVGETVAFAASSGAISNTNRVTDTNGSVAEKLSVRGDSSLRDISITASVGTVTSTVKKISVIVATSSVASVQLTSSSGTLPSAGSSAVTMVALVKDAGNAVVKNTTVSFSSDSGALNQSSAVTDVNGIASVSLSTGSDPSLRTITVTANASGNKSSTPVAVTGTKLVINSSNSINLGSSTDMTVKLVDSAGNPLNNKPVTFSALFNPVTVKGGGAAVTDSSGQMILTYRASSFNNDTVTVKALGDTATAAIAVNASNFTVKVVDASAVAQASALINTCQRIAVHNDLNGVAQTGNVTISASRGTVYSDNACTSALLAPVAFSAGGDAGAYVQATSPGVATLTARAESTGATVQGIVEFTAPLTSTSTISVQADPAVVGANTSGNTTQQSSLRAVVRDAQNNLVKNAQVSFSIVTDLSGGSLLAPTVVTTGSDGAATVGYVAGTITTALNGVVIKAQLQGVSTNSNTVSLTVAKKSLFISAGTGNTLSMPDSTTYRIDYVVFVTDAAGNPVPDVNITGSVVPRTYSKGVMQFVGTAGPWTAFVSTTCANEDTDNSGIFTAAKDINGNGRLDPGIPINVTPAGKTNSDGMATVSFTYPRDRANWLAVDFTIRGQVSGTEATYVGYIPLVGLSSDYSDRLVSPPGAVSPYGKASLCSNPN